ncbi:MAG: nucleoside hydrolase, partial [Duodenibacillus sp.]|nr:nucleoside hydrolase [Duodenibacillus sp.]
TDMTYLNDDAYALFELLQADKAGHLELLGVTAAGGNCLVASAVWDALGQLERAGRGDVPVYAGEDRPLAGFKDIGRLQERTGRMSYTGAYRFLGRYTADWRLSARNGLTRSPLPPPAGRPQEQPAADFIAEQVRKHPGRVTIIALAGLTNIARALQKDPAVARDAAAIYYMGGVFDVPGEDLPAAEFNWWYDPAAANACLKAPWRRQVVVPHDAAVKCLKGRDMYEMYKAANGTRISSMIVESLAPVYENGKQEPLRYCWDPITVAALMCPDLIKRQEKRQVWVDDREGPTYGSSFAWAAGAAPAIASEPVDVIFEVDRTRFWQFCADLYNLGDE